LLASRSSLTAQRPREIRIHGSRGALIGEGWQVADDGGQTAWITDAAAIAFSGRPFYPGKTTEPGPLWPSGNSAAVKDMGSRSPPFMTEIARGPAGSTSPFRPELQTRRTRGSAHLPRALSPPAPRSPKTKPSPVPAPTRRGLPVHRPRGHRRAERPDLAASTRDRRGTTNRTERRFGFVLESR
jgi:hypothetical protein